MTKMVRRPASMYGLKQELASFDETWFANLKDQGFLGDTATRERLSGAFYS